MTCKRILSACAAFAFGVFLLAAMPLSAGITAAVYAEEGDGGSGQLWCHLCDKPFPCGYSYTGPDGLYVYHADMGDGTVDECAVQPNTAEAPPATIDSGGAKVGGGQGGGSSSGFEDSDGTDTGGAATFGDGQSITDTDTPTSGATGLWAGFTGLMGDTVLDEDGGVKTWAKAAGVIIIALIALGIVYSSVRHARRRRRKKARSL